MDGLMYMTAMNDMVTIQNYGPRWQVSRGASCLIRLLLAALAKRTLQDDMHVYGLLGCGKARQAMQHGGPLIRTTRGGRKVVLYVCVSVHSLRIVSVIFKSI